MRKYTALLLVAIVVLTACGSTTVPQAQTQFCQSLTTLNTALGQMSSISAQSTVDEFKTAQQAVDSAVAGVQKSAAGLREAKMDEINGAYDDLNRVMRSVSNQDTLAQASVQIAPAVSKIQAAEASLGRVVCPK
jgi:hypothetical protein